MPNFTREPIGHAYMADDGVEKHLWRETYTAIYPYPRTVRRYIAEPTPRGKQSEAYMVTRAMLGDDWISDLTDSETLPNVIMAAGLTAEQTYDVLIGMSPASLAITNRLALV